MKSKHSFLLLTATGIVLSMGLLITACNKSSSSGSSTTTTDNDAVTMTTSAATADNQYNDVLNVGLQVGAGGSTTIDRTGGSVISGSGRATEVDGGGTSPCAVLSTTITDSTVYPVTLNINFGTGCTGNDGITRKGSITYVFSGPVFQSGTMIAATFSGYSVDGYELGGTYSITNTTSGGIPSFVTKVTSGQITFPDSVSYTYSGTRTITQTSGIGTLDLMNYVYSITGTHSFSSSAGKSLTDSITTALVWPLSCGHIVSGDIAFTFTEGGSSVNGTLDYGNGTCDSLATITIGPITKTVTLP